MTIHMLHVLLKAVLMYCCLSAQGLRIKDEASCNNAEMAGAARVQSMRLQ